MDERMDSAYLWLDEFGSDAVVPPELATPLQSSLNPGNGSCGLPLGSSQVPNKYDMAKFNPPHGRLRENEYYSPEDTFSGQPEFLLVRQVALLEPRQRIAVWREMGQNLVVHLLL